MSLASLIPTSIATVGSICLGLAVVIVLINPQGGKVHWGKTAGICALIGGIGALAGAGGWLGAHIASWSSSATNTAASWLSSAVGTGGVVLVGVVVALLVWKHLGKGGNGTEAAKGGHQGMGGKVKALLIVGGFAIAGAFLGTIPWIYDTANWVVASGGGALQSLVS